MADIPDIYSDSVSIQLNVWGLSLSFSASIVPPNQQFPIDSEGTALPAEPKAVVRMSVQHGKALAMSMRRIIKQWETNNGEIHIPPGVLTGLGLDEEIW